VDQRHEDQAAEANSGRCESKTPLDCIGLGPTSCDEEENLLEGARATKEEIGLKQAGRVGAETPTRP
jgi:hypothetical protein